MRSLVLSLSALLPSLGRDDERTWAVWDHPEAAILHYPRQVRVDVVYSAYRRAYIRAFPEVDLTGRSGPRHESASRASEGLQVSANRTNL
jgi:hypothetical protein